MEFKNQITTFYSKSLAASRFTIRQLSNIIDFDFLVNESNTNSEYDKEIELFKIRFENKKFLKLSDKLDNKYYIYWAWDNNPLTNDLINELKNLKKTIFIFTTNEYYFKLKIYNSIDVIYDSKTKNDRATYFVGKDKAQLNTPNLISFLKRSLIFDKIK